MEASNPSQAIRWKCKVRALPSLRQFSAPPYHDHTHWYQKWFGPTLTIPSRTVWNGGLYSKVRSKRLSMYLTLLEILNITSSKNLEWSPTLQEKCYWMKFNTLTILRATLNSTPCKSKLHHPFDVSKKIIFFTKAQTNNTVPSFISCEKDCRLCVCVGERIYFSCMRMLTGCSACTE